MAKMPVGGKKCGKPFERFVKSCASQRLSGSLLVGRLEGGMYKWSLKVS